MIYPMEKGEIAIHVSTGPTGIVLLLCHETEAWCVASIGDSPRGAWFQDRQRLPEAFVREALATLVPKLRLDCASSLIVIAFGSILPRTGSTVSQSS